MMKANYTIICLAALLLSTVSCREEFAEYAADSRLTISAETEDMSKSIIDGTSFRWTEDDKFGLYINQTISPVINALCTISSISGDGKKAYLKTEYEIAIDMTGERSVAAFYPYKSFPESSSDLLLSVPQTQRQKSADAAHIQNCDFMSSRPQIHEDGKTLDLKFRHHMAKMDFIFINEHTVPLTVTEIAIISPVGKKVFGTSASLDLFSADPALRISENSKVSRIGVALSGEWTIVNPDESLTASIMMMPVNLEDEELQVIVYTKEKGEFIYDKSGLDFLPQNRYRTVLAAREKDLIVNTDVLAISESQENATFKLTAINGLLPIEIKSDIPGLTFSKDSLSLFEGESETITVTVDRRGLKNGKTSGTISIISGEIIKEIKVDIYTTGVVEINSPTDYLIVNFENCSVDAGTATIRFTVTNTSSKNCNLVLNYSSYYSNNNNTSSFAYDEFGNEYRISTINGSSNCSTILEGGSTVEFTVVTENNIQSNAGQFSVVDISTRFSFGNDNYSYGDVVFKNIPISNKTKGSMVKALDLNKKFDSTFGGIDFEIYDIGHFGNTVKLYYRILNSASADYVFDIPNASIFCYDSAGNGYPISKENLGYVSSDSYYTRIPSGIWCNGTISISNVFVKFLHLHHISLRIRKARIIQRTGESSLSYDSWEASTLTIKDLPLGTEPDPSPVEPSTTAGSYSGLPENVDMEITGAKVSEGTLRIDYRLLNKYSFLKHISLFVPSGITYIIDNRDNYYGISSSESGLSCNSYDAYLAPDVPCNGYFEIKGFDREASSIKCLSTAASVYNNYDSSNEVTKKITVNNIAVEEREPSQFQPVQPSTTADNIWCDIDCGLDFTPISCTVSDKSSSASFRIRNSSGESKYVNFYENNSSLFDNLGNKYSINSISIGGIKKNSGAMIPSGYETEVEIAFSAVPVTATKLSYSQFDIRISDSYRKSYDDGYVYIKNLDIEGRTGEPDDPVTTDCESIKSWDKIIATKLISCRMNGDDAIIEMKIKNTSSTPKSISLYNSSIPNESRTYAYDYRGNNYLVKDLAIGASGLTSCTIMPETWCKLSFSVAGISKETGLLKHVSIYSSTFSSSLELVNLKIEDKEEKEVVWPAQETSFGETSSPVDGLSFKGIAAKSDKEGTLTLEYLVSNSENSVCYFSPYISDMSGAFCIDDLGNYYWITKIQFGDWYSSSSLSIHIPGKTTCRCSIQIKGFNGESSSIKVLCIPFGSSTSSSRLVMKDIAVQNRTAISFPEPKTSCDSSDFGNSIVDIKVLRCYLDEKGKWRLRISLTNKTQDIRVIEHRGDCRWFYGSTYYCDSYEAIQFGNFTLQYRDYILWPKIPEIIEFISKSFSYEGDSFSKFTYPYYLRTGYEGNRSEYQMTLTGIKIEGRTQE